MTIYLDIIFFENILMNYIILAAVNVVTKNDTTHRQLRMITSSFIGSVYAVITYLKIFKIYESIFAKIILSVVMIYITFAPKIVKELVKKLLIFYMASFVFGGCTIALMYVINPENVKLKNGVFVGTYPIKVAVIAGVIAFVVMQIVFKINKSKITAKDMICTLKILFNNKEVEMKAFIDTGNMLKDPISELPVIVVEEKIMKKIIPDEFFEYIHNNLGGDWEKSEIEMYKNKIRIIPFMSLGKENGLLVGIKVDEVQVFTYDEEKRIKDVIVGIYRKNLSKENKYHALIGLNLLEKENKQKDELITNF